MTDTHRRWRPPDAVLLAALLLTLAATAAIAVSGRSEAQADSSRRFQGALQGFGLGRAVDLSRCAAAFDPRLGGGCDLRHGPVPASSALCPDHALRLPAGGR